MNKAGNHVAYRVHEKIFETPRTASLILRPDQQVTYQAGQFITFLFDGLSVEQLRRSYSISSVPGIDQHIRVTVQKIPNGLVSRHLVDRVEPGDSLTGLRPKGRFVLPRHQLNQNEPVVLIGGGSGFTPLFSILGDLLSRNVNARAILILANSSPGQILFRKELFRLIRTYTERLFVRFVISKPTESFLETCALYPNVEMHAGRVTNALAEQWITLDCGQETDTRPWFYICGPVGLKLKVIPVIRMMGYPEERIFEEDFIIVEPFRPDASAFRDALMKLNFNGTTYEVEIPAGKTILEAALENGIELPYHCRSGICTTCSGKCTSGKAVMYGQDVVTDTEQAGGEVLTCVAYPLSPEIRIEICG